MANFDKNLPPEGVKARFVNDQVRDNNDALEDALVRSGMKFPSGYGVDAGEFLVPVLQKQSADPATPAANKLKFYAKTVGAQPRLYIKDPAGDVKSLAVLGEDIIPSGTKMLFYQDTAPTGWTIQDTLDDKLVFVTKGNAAGGQTGGTVHSSGVWTISGFGNVGNHILTENEIPSHRHTMLGSAVIGAGVYVSRSASGTANSYSEYTGGGGAHNHAMAAHDGSDRPAAYCCIICGKD